MDEARDAYWSALERADRFAALTAVKRLRDQGLDALHVVQELVVPAQHRIGELWEDGRWSVEQEHAATAVNEGLVHWLCSFADAPDPDRPLVVVACLQGEAHALPALVVAEGLNAANYQVNYVGGDPDPSELLELVLALKPRAVLLSGSLTSSLARQRTLFASLAAIGVPVVVGGRAFGGDERRALAIGATAYAEDVEAAVALLERLPARLPPRAPEPLTPAQTEAEWLLTFAREIAPYVVSALASRYPGTGHTETWWTTLQDHVEHVLGCLASAMVTGDETIVVEVGEWLERVLETRGAPAALVAELWAVLAEPLRGHPLARLHLAGAAPGVAPTTAAPAVAVRVQETAEASRLAGTGDGLGAPA